MAQQGWPSDLPQATPLDRELDPGLSVLGKGGNVVTKVTTSFAFLNAKAWRLCLSPTSLVFEKVDYPVGGWLQRWLSGLGVFSRWLGITQTPPASLTDAETPATPSLKCKAVLSLTPRHIAVGLVTDPDGVYPLAVFEDSPLTVAVHQLLPNGSPSVPTFGLGERAQPSDSADSKSEQGQLIDEFLLQRFVAAPKHSKCILNFPSFKERHRLEAHLTTHICTLRRQALEHNYTGEDFDPPDPKQTSFLSSITTALRWRPQEADVMEFYNRADSLESTSQEPSSPNVQRFSIDRDRPSSLSPHSTAPPTSPSETPRILWDTGNETWRNSTPRRNRKAAAHRPIRELITEHFDFMHKLPPQ